MHIRSVTKKSGSTFKVEYTTSFGERGDIELFATDELEAFTNATKLLGKRSMTARVFLLCSTVVILAAFSLVGYGCTRNNQFRETCLKAGKSYVSENNGYSCK